MEKYPPKQRTFTLRGLPDADSEANFQAFITFVSRHARHIVVQAPRRLSKAFDFNARITQTTIGDMTWLKCESCAFSVYRNYPDQKHIRLVFCSSGKMTVVTEGVSRILKPGTFIIDAAERETTFTITETTEMVVLVVSESYFHAHSGFHSPTYLGALFDGETAVQRFFGRQLKGIARDAGNLDARDVGNVCDGIFCFLRPVLSEFNRSVLKITASHRSQDELRTAAIEVMQKRFSNPALRVKDIADAIGISERYLTALFRNSGTTVMKTLYNLRLRLASVHLCEEHFLQNSVAQIAVRNGFRSSTHFGRLFKRQYGITPNEWRNQHRQ